MCILCQRMNLNLINIIKFIEPHVIIMRQVKRSQGNA